MLSPVVHNNNEKRKIMQIVFFLFRGLKVIQYRAPEKDKIFQRKEEQKTCFYYNGEGMSPLACTESRLFLGSGSVSPIQ